MDSTDRIMDHAEPAASRPAPLPLGAVARRLDLTPAELRLLERLLAGDALPAAARRLGIRETDAAGVLARLLRKAGAADPGALEDRIHDFADAPAA